MHFTFFFNATIFIQKRVFLNEAYLLGFFDAITAKELRITNMIYYLNYDILLFN